MQFPRKWPPESKVYERMSYSVSLGQATSSRLLKMCISSLANLDHATDRLFFLLGLCGIQFLLLKKKDTRNASDTSVRVCRDMSGLGIPKKLSGSLPGLKHAATLTADSQFFWSLYKNLGYLSSQDPAPRKQLGNFTMFEKVMKIRLTPKPGDPGSTRQSASRRSLSFGRCLWTCHRKSRQMGKTWTEYALWYWQRRNNHMNHNGGMKVNGNISPT